MTLSRRQILTTSTLSLTATAIPGTASAAGTDPARGGGPAAGRRRPLIIEEQGTFTAGGTITRTPGTFNPRTPFDPAGQTLHGDHASVRYQIPEDSRPYPLVFLHGAGQSSRCWESTPDGREGFGTLFLRRRYPVYLVDQRRRPARRAAAPVPRAHRPGERRGRGGQCRGRPRTSGVLRAHRARRPPPAEPTQLTRVEALQTRTTGVVRVLSTTTTMPRVARGGRRRPAPMLTVAEGPGHHGGVKARPSARYE